MLPDNLREFGDTAKARSWIYENALEGVKNRFPIEDDEYKLELADPRYDGKQDYTLAEQKNALLKQRRLYTPIRGTWRLTHKPSGTVLDEREDTVMQVPYLTDRGTFIHNGNEYSGVNQSRLKPGVYSRITNAGNPEAFYNIAPGTGKNFRIEMEPDTGIFRMRIAQANIPVYPLLKTLGIDDKTILNTWGPEITEANAKVRSADSVDKLHARLVGKFGSQLPNVDRAQEIRDALGKYEVDPDVVAKTLGIQSKTLTPAMFLRTTQKLLGISREEEDPDDRDAPMHSNIMAYEDFIRERIDKDAGKLAKSLFMRVKRDKVLKRVPFGALNPYIDGYILGSKLTMPLEETNPMHTWDQMHRVVKMGEGGISSAESVTDAARDVNLGQLGFIDPVAGPESYGIGVDTRVTYKTFKGRDQQMYAEFNDLKTGKPVYLRPENMDGKVLAFPGEDISKPDNMVTASRNGKIVKVPVSEVDYQVPSMAHMFAHGVNAGTMPTGMMPGRSFYASKYWSQLMPLAKGEVPLVDTVMPDDNKTFLEHYGRKIGSIASPADGVVTKVTDDKVVVTAADGTKHVRELVKDFPFNRLTGISYFPSVKPGDQVKAGDMLAHSNFTDAKTGSLNMGTNLKVAIIPAKGHSYEDAYVVSETAAKKLTNERLLGFDLDAKHGVEIDKNKYISLFPKTFTPKQTENIDERGVVRPGTVVNQGDPLILGVGPKVLSAEELKLGKLHKALRAAHTNRAIVWEHDYPGVVTDADITGKTAIANVKAQAPLVVGDKIVTMHALKGVVGRIVPDDQMPKDAATNEPYEVMLNPMGILSRVSPNQLAVIQLAKIAKKTGQQLRIPQDPPKEGWAQWTVDQLKKHGIKENTDIFDPETGTTVPGISDGYVYVSAFHHLAEKKLSDRGGGGAGGYTSGEQPAHGGHAGGGAKRFGSLDINAALSHGAHDVIKDVINIRGAKNEEFWKALKLGRPLPETKVPFIYNKFLNLLKSGGINIREKGDTLSLLPMTDDDVTQMSGGAISDSGMVDRNFEPVAGGLFDLGKTGGIAGNRWSHIELPSPVPNPVFEEPIRRMLGLKQAELEDILAGTKDVNGKTGGEALQDMLSKLDIDAEMERHKSLAMRMRGSNRDNSIKVLGYLQSLKKQGSHPTKLMITKVPVIPPIFRPVSKMGDIMLQADLNELYRDVIESSKHVKDVSSELGNVGAAEERLNLYNSVKAAFGLGEPITPEGRSKGLKGSIHQIIGNTPKSGLFQSKVIAKPVDVVGRGVITPDPNLDMDSIGIPEESAWTLYSPFIMRNLVRRGFPAEKVMELIKNKDNTAKAALTEEMRGRPVIVDRAPTWHKFNLLAFHPHLVKDKVIRVSPLITSGFNADFDGDTMNFHVPVSEKAVKNAYERMLPSKNLTSLTDLRSVRHPPSKEFSMGLYMLTRDPSNKPVKVFPSVEAAKQAYARGEIRANDPIEIRK